MLSYHLWLNIGLQSVGRSARVLELGFCSVPRGRGANAKKGAQGVHVFLEVKPSTKFESYLTVQEGVIVLFTNPLLVPGLAEELGRGVLGLVLGKVEAEGLEGDGLGDGRGRSGGGRAGGGEGGGRSGEGEDEALREGSHGFLIAC